VEIRILEAGPEGKPAAFYGVNKIMGIDVLDHIIITKNKVFSFKEKKLI